MAKAKTKMITGGVYQNPNDSNGVILCLAARGTIEEAGECCYLTRGIVYLKIANVAETVTTMNLEDLLSVYVAQNMRTCDCDLPRYCSQKPPEVQEPIHYVTVPKDLKIVERFREEYQSEEEAREKVIWVRNYEEVEDFYGNIPNGSLVAVNAEREFRGGRRKVMVVGILCGNVVYTTDNKPQRVSSAILHLPASPDYLPEVEEIHRIHPKLKDHLNKAEKQ